MWGPRPRWDGLSPAVEQWRSQQAPQPKPPVAWQRPVVSKSQLTSPAHMLCTGRSTADSSRRWETSLPSSQDAGLIFDERAAPDKELIPPTDDYLPQLVPHRPGRARSSNGSRTTSTSASP
jgi:hypothetical protein